MSDLIETPSVALARVVAPLEPTKASLVAEAFGPVFQAMDEWEREARGLQVTDATQVGKMKRARLLRLEIKDKRVELDKRRKAMKEGIVREGRAIDGAFAIFVGIAEPLEARLLEQETFAAREAAARRDALREARVAALQALQVAALPEALGEMSEEAWALVLGDARGAKAERERIAAEEEAARVEAARLLAERRAAEYAERVKAEAERQAREEERRAEVMKLREEAAERERAAAMERQRVEAEREEERRQAAAVQAKHDAERAEARRAQEARELAARRELQSEVQAKVKAELEAEALRQAEAARVAKEAEAKKPTKAKYAVLVAALRRIASNPYCDPGCASPSEAREALAKVGEAVE